MSESKSIILRAIEKTDLEVLREWRNNPLLRSYFREHKEISFQDQLFWYDHTVVPKDKTLMYAIEDRKSHSLIGACGLCYIDWLRRSADLSIYIGWQDIYLDDVMAVESAQILIDYGFGEIGLHRIWAEVYSHDTKKQDFFQSLGFTLEGRLRESHWSDGKWLDSLYYGLLSGEEKK